MELDSRDLFDEEENVADHMEVGVSPPTSEDTAIVMYTSGSTGTPKGLIKHSWKFLIIQY